MSIETFGSAVAPGTRGLWVRAADVWLVDRTAGGKERSELQSLRTVPHQPIPFYFDGIRQGTARFDVFGTLIAEADSSGLVLSLEAIRARTEAGAGHGYQAVRWYRSTVHVKPDEVVEVALPAEPEVALDGHTLALRVRARQVR